MSLYFQAHRFRCPHLVRIIVNGVIRPIPLPTSSIKQSSILASCLPPSSIPTTLTSPQKSQQFISKFIHSTNSYSTNSSNMDVEIPAHLFSPNPSPDTISEAQSLLAAEKTPWKLIHSPPGLQRTFKFKGFVAAMKFVNAVADEAKAQNHHPEWGNAYNEVVVRWTTHRPKGISEKDVYMAGWCDRRAAEFGEVFHSSPAPEQKESEKKSYTVPQGDLREGLSGQKTDRFDSTSTGSAATYRPEISYPGMSNNNPYPVEDDLLTSILGAGERECKPCHTRNNKSKATGTESGAGNSSTHISSLLKY